MPFRPRCRSVPRWNGTGGHLRSCCRTSPQALRARVRELVPGQTRPLARPRKLLWPSDRRPCCGLRCVRRRGSRCGVVNWLRFCRELERERGVDLEVAQEEGALVETLSPEPTSDLVVALARVAGAARRRDVVERVSTAAGQRQNAVALERLVGRTAVRASAPRVLQRRPLPGAQVVLHTSHAALALARTSRLPTPIDRHRSSVGRADGTPSDRAPS